MLKKLIKISFRLHDGAPEEYDGTPYRKEVRLTPLVYSLAQSFEEEITVISMYEKVLDLNEQRRAAGEKPIAEGGLKHRVTQILAHLESTGYLRSLGFRNKKMSDISFTDDQRAAITDLVTSIARFNTEDELVIREGRALARTIVNDKDRVRSLVEKAKEHAPGRIRAEKIKGSVLSILQDHPEGISSMQIRRILAEDYAIDRGYPRIAAFMTELKSTGQLAVLRTGSSNLYGPVTDSEASEDADLAKEPSVQQASRTIGEREKAREMQPGVAIHLNREKAR